MPTRMLRSREEALSEAFVFHLVHLAHPTQKAV